MHRLVKQLQWLPCLLVLCSRIALCQSEPPSFALKIADVMGRAFTRLVTGPAAEGMSPPEFQTGGLEILSESIRDYLDDRSKERQLEAKEPTIRAQLAKSNGVVMVQVKFFNAGMRHYDPVVDVMGYGPSPMEALNNYFDSPPQLMNANPPGSLLNVGKTYMMWGFQTGNKIVYSPFPSGMLIDASPDQIHNLAAQAAQAREITKQIDARRDQALATLPPIGSLPQPPAGSPPNGRGGPPRGGGGGNGPGGDLHGAGGNGGGGGGNNGGAGGGGNGGGHVIDFGHEPLHIGGHPSGEMMLSMSNPLQNQEKTSKPNPLTKTEEHTKPAFDWGIEGTRIWRDINGDGIPDFCRLAGGGRSAVIKCTLATGRSIDHMYDGATFQGEASIWETENHSPGTWVDGDSDGMLHFCSVGYARGSVRLGRIRCLWVDGKRNVIAGYIASEGSLANDLGEPTGRAWVDFNGDGKTDFCTVTMKSSKKVVLCYLSDGKQFSKTPVISGEINWRNAPGERTWVDVNFDGKADFCTTAGPHDQFLDCTVSTGVAFSPVYRDVLSRK